MITDADLAGYQAKAHGKKIPPGTKRKKTSAPISAPEEQLAWQLTGAGISYLRNMPFHPRRRWTMDFAILPPQQSEEDRASVLFFVEVQGGGHQGKHQRMTGYENDLEKHAEAMMLGFFVLPVTPRQIVAGKVLVWIQRILSTQPRSCRRLLT